MKGGGGRPPGKTGRRYTGANTGTSRAQKFTDELASDPRRIDDPFEITRDLVDPAAMFRHANMTPDRWQAEEFDRWSGTLDNTALVSPRRRGKSAWCSAVVAHLLWSRPGAEVGVVGPTEAHGIELVREVRRYLLALPPQIRPWLVVESSGRLELDSGSRLRAGTANPSSVRGWGIDLLVLEEASYLSSDLITAAWPCIFERRGRVLAVSTPARGASWFRSLFDDPAGSGKGWHTRHIRPEDSDRFSAEMLEAARGQMTAEAHRREYEGAWADSDSGSGRALSDIAVVTDETGSAELLEDTFSTVALERGFHV